MLRFCSHCNGMVCARRSTRNDSALRRTMIIAIAAANSSIRWFGENAAKKAEQRNAAKGPDLALRLEHRHQQRDAHTLGHRGCERQSDEQHEQRAPAAQQRDAAAREVEVFADFAGKHQADAAMAPSKIIEIISVIPVGASAKLATELKSWE